MDLCSIEINQAIEPLYGKGARLVETGDGLFDWKVRTASGDQHLDMGKVVDRLLGPDFRPVSVGVHKYDWRAINFDSGHYDILPVLMLPKEKIGAIAGVRSAAAALIGGLEVTRDWYAAQLGGKTFRIVPEAIVVWTAASADEWNAWAQVTDVPDTVQQPPGSGHEVPNPKDPYPHDTNREYLLRKHQRYIESAFKRSIDTSTSIVCVATYTGFGGAASGAGAIDTGHFVSQPPSLVELDPRLYPMTDRRRTDAIYALGHELGHAFGLAHSGDKYKSDPQWRNSIMENPSLHFLDALLLNAEKLELAGCRFIR